MSYESWRREVRWAARRLMKTKRFADAALGNEKGTDEKTAKDMPETNPENNGARSGPDLRPANALPVLEKVRPEPSPLDS